MVRPYLEVQNLTSGNLFRLAHVDMGDENENK